MKYVIGVDVGTASARAGLFDERGRSLAKATRPITIFDDGSGVVFEQSTDDIWGAVCECVKEVVTSSGVPADQIAAIGFDATCSLAVLDAEGQPVSVSDSGDPHKNIVMWMDHRAQDQADKINATGHDMLRFVGGKISLEMQLPKILWLKEVCPVFYVAYVGKLPNAFKKAAHFLDLPDFLTSKATGNFSRSLCSLVCKFTYDATSDSNGWDDSFLRAIQLDGLSAGYYAKLGTDVRVPGQAAGPLCASAAEEMGLREGTCVAVSIIDAHAGVLGVHGAEEGELQACLSVISGTSSCHMALAREPLYIPGIWGPFKDAIIQGYYLSEAGQSATGALIDHAVKTHAMYAEASQAADKCGTSVYDYLNGRIVEMASARGLQDYELLTQDIHVLPYHHGNRSPLADPTLMGTISGLRLSCTVDDLAVLYLATVQAIALGTRHIVETLAHGGHGIEVMVMTGGLAKNKLFVQAHADAVGLLVRICEEEDSVLLGSAVLAACAGGVYPNAQTAMGAMSRVARTVEPKKHLDDFFRRKFLVFRTMHAHQLEYRELMSSSKPA